MTNGDLLESLSDGEILKAVTSSTKLKILSNLNVRPMTAAELAHNLGIYKSGINKHISILLTTNLVERIESDQRKWVYYKLTEKGTEIISKMYMLFLIAGIIGGLAIVAALANFYFSKYSETLESGLTRGFNPVKPLISFGDVTLLLIVIFVILLFIAWLYLKKKKYTH
ncbi:MAG: winged helix-turn-helix domain-containing protein [Candidatus Methanoperedens sp.]|nr:winged helix-turn-helix domain-containing protein [Candidatus Methanoperedens sp.]